MNKVLEIQLTYLQLIKYHLKQLLASKQYREDPEYRQKSRQATFARPLDEGTYDVIDESFTSYFDGGIVSVLKGVK